MWKSIASNALTLLIVGLFLIAGLIAWGVQEYREPGPLTQGICVEVPSGSSMRDVSEQLAAKDAIRYPALFRVGADYAGKNADLKAGSFLVEDGASMEEIVAIVTGSGQSTCGTEIVWRIGVTRNLAQIRTLDPATGRYEDLAEWQPAEDPAPEAYAAQREKSDTQYRVVIAEGVTSWQVVDSLSAIALLEGAVSAIPAEGTLAPDSYAIKPGDSAPELIARMEAAQAARLAKVWEARSDRTVVDTPEEALILASIIEKETGVPEERRRVAAVFSNRLEAGMRLQTDPTVIYGITEGKGVLGRGLRRSELDRVTPWNTYQIDGLPKTAIANPGIESLRAAVDPAEDDVLYFVADGTGGHAFATTLEAHNRNVARWRQIEADRAASGGNGG